MNAMTADLAAEFEKLPAAEQHRLRDEVSALTRARQREALARLHGCAEGEGLLAQLLEDRAKEWAQDEARLRDGQSRGERRSWSSLPPNERGRARAKLALHPPA